MERLYHIHRSISMGNYPAVKRLAERFEVSRRTIERDLEFLRDRMNAPLQYNSQRRGYEYTDDFELPPFNFSEEEVVATILAARLLRQYSELPLQTHAELMTDKLVHLANVTPPEFEQVGRYISFDLASLRGNEGQVREALEVSLKAIQHRVNIHLEYFGAYRGQASDRKVSPYHVRNKDGAWYLIGYCHMRKDIRTFALDRIIRIGLVNESFTYPEDFSVEKYLADSWGIEKGKPGRMVIRFSKEEAPWVDNRVWHPSQKKTWEEDGSLILEFTVGSYNEVLRWVLQFGSSAEIIEPESFREMATMEIGKMLENYE